MFIEADMDRIKKIEGDQKELGGKWELCKQDIKLKAIERSCRLKYEQGIKENTLKSNLEKLVEQENKALGFFMEYIQQLKQCLDVIDQDRYRGASVRARTGRLVVGEMPTKRMRGVEKANARRNQINEVEWKGRLIII